VYRQGTGTTHTHTQTHRPCRRGPGRMRGAAVLLLLLSGRAAFTAAMSLNAPRDGTDGPTGAVTGNDYRKVFDL